MFRVKVPPWTSSRVSLFCRARWTRSLVAWASPADAHPVGVVYHGDGQSLRGGHRYPHVNMLFQDDLVAAPGGVKRRMLFEGFDHRFDDEGKVGQLHPFVFLEARPALTAQGHQIGYVPPLPCSRAWGIWLTLRTIASAIMRRTGVRGMVSSSCSWAG